MPLGEPSRVARRRPSDQVAMQSGYETSPLGSIAVVMQNFREGP
jgi:hypothetical protein